MTTATPNKVSLNIRNKHVCIVQAQVYPRRNEYGGERAKPRIYLSKQNQGVLDEMFSGERYNKPYNLIRPKLDEIMTALGFKPENWKYNWDRYAGCKMCPCSPGFKISGMEWIPEQFNVEITYKYIKV